MFVNISRMNNSALLFALSFPTKDLHFKVTVSIVPVLFCLVYTITPILVVSISCLYFACQCHYASLVCHFSLSCICQIPVICRLYVLNVFYCQYYCLYLVYHFYFVIGMSTALFIFGSSFLNCTLLVNITVYLWFIIVNMCFSI